MTHRTIPQRELRNDVGAVLRAAEAGDTFTITVHGRPVARLGPLAEPPGPRLDVDPTTIARILDGPVDDQLADDLAAWEAPVGGQGR